MLEYDRLGLYSKFNRPDIEYEIKSILQHKKKGNVDFNIAILDIDGTLTNDEHRRHYIKEREKPDYTSYQMECIHDTLNDAILNSIAGKEYNFVFLVSGRYYEYLDITINQICSSPAGLRMFGKLVGVNMRSSPLIGTVQLKKYGIQRCMNTLEDVYFDVAAAMPDGLKELSERRLICYWDMWDDDIRCKQFATNSSSLLYTGLYHNIQFFANQYYNVTKDSYTEEIYHG